MKEPTIRLKSFQFALRIIQQYKHLQSNKNEYVLSKQVLRSGTSIGALVSESKHAESKADFIHKLAIAQKEANETNYWIELLWQSEYITQTEYDSIFKDLSEIQKIITSIILTSKAKNNS